MTDTDARADFMAAAETLGRRRHPGHRVVAVAFCKDHPAEHCGPCLSCVYHGDPYGQEVSRIAHLHAALPALADLFEVLTDFVAEYPDLGREHVDGKPCSDYACAVVTRLRSVARVLMSVTAADGRLLTPATPEEAGHG